MATYRVLKPFNHGGADLKKDGTVEIEHPREARMLARSELIDGNPLPPEPEPKKKTAPAKKKTTAKPAAGGGNDK